MEAGKEAGGGRKDGGKANCCTDISVTYISFPFLAPFGQAKEHINFVLPPEWAFYFFGIAGTAMTEQKLNCFLDSKMLF